MKLASSEPKPEVTSLKQFWKLQAQAQTKDLEIIKKHIRASVGEEVDSGHTDQADCQSLKLQTTQPSNAQESDRSDILSKILPAISLAETLSPWVLTSPYLQVLGYDKISIKLERSSHKGTQKKIKEVSFVKPQEIIKSLPRNLSVQSSLEKPKESGSNARTISEQHVVKTSVVNQSESFVKQQPISQERTKQKDDDYVSVISSKSLNKRGRKNRGKKREIPAKQISIKSNYLRDCNGQSVKQGSVNLMSTLQNQGIVSPKRARQQSQQKELTQEATATFGAKRNQIGVVNTRAKRNNNRQPVKYAVDQYLERRKTRQSIDQIKTPPLPKIYSPDQVFEHESSQLLNDSMQPNDKSSSTKNTDKVSAQLAIHTHQKPPQRFQQPIKQKLHIQQKIIGTYQSAQNYTEQTQKDSQIIYNQKEDSYAKEVLNTHNKKEQSIFNDKKDDENQNRAKMITANIKILPDGTVKRPRGRPFGWRKSRAQFNNQEENSKKIAEQIDQKQKKIKNILTPDLTAPSKRLQIEQTSKSYIGARLVRQKSERNDAAQIFEQSATPVAKNLQNNDSDRDFYEEVMESHMGQKQSKGSSKSKRRKSGSKDKTNKQQFKDKLQKLFKQKPKKQESLSKKKSNVLQEVNKSMQYPSYQYQQTYQQMIVRKAKQASEMKKDKDSFDESEENSQEQLGSAQEKALRDLMGNQ